MRRVMLFVGVGLAVLAMTFMLFERHRTDHHDWHSTTSRELEHALVVWTVGAIVCAFMTLALRFGFVLGIVAGVAAMFGGVVMVIAAAIVHLFFYVTHDIVGQAMLASCLALSLAGLVIVIGELVLRVAQRRENRQLRELPLAVVIER